MEHSDTSAEGSMDRPRSIRDRFPPPWRLEDVPGGYRVTDGHGRPLAYVYGVDGGARSALPEALTRAEARALAAAIARLPELMPTASAAPREPEDG
jgi:hypothetical protein